MGQQSTSPVLKESTAKGDVLRDDLLHNSIKTDAGIPIKIFLV